MYALIFIVKRSCCVRVLKRLYVRCVIPNEKMTAMGLLFANESMCCGGDIVSVWCVGALTYMECVLSYYISVAVLLHLCLSARVCARQVTPFMTDSFICSVRVCVVTFLAARQNFQNCNFTQKKVFKFISAQIMFCEMAMRSFTIVMVSDVFVRCRAYNYKVIIAVSGELYISVCDTSGRCH